MGLAVKLDLCPAVFAGDGADFLGLGGGQLRAQCLLEILFIDR
ncbi:hypothetical protein GCM10011498_11700 [Amylibacter cionae]|uniref:Uncharacterized protein n=1 Tax=Neptunicoccus cionae TaxID=2035344 RepID=A0A916QV93_9RHOB|nr:hypothetical protein GCM10011498_11700 [Amylibacter cionae]